jgi:hypothetical protein
MQDTTLVIVIAAIPPTLIALATFVKQVMMGWTVDTVEKNTNSRVSEQDRKIESLMLQVTTLTKQIADMETTRATLAAEKKS